VETTEKTKIGKWENVETMGKQKHGKQWWEKWKMGENVEKCSELLNPVRANCWISAQL
jgi:hypothetical protein